MITEQKSSRHAKTQRLSSTEEIDAWWDRGPTNFYDVARAVAKRFESGVGGRYLVVYDDITGDALEIGRITVWEPGSRFVYRSSLDDTEVEVRFEAITGSRTGPTGQLASPR